jgi:hypothetical protein
VQSDVIKTLPYKQLNKLFLISKWGFDGSSGLSQYKQKFDDQRNLNNGNSSNASIFTSITSFVPTQLINGDPKLTNKTIIWQNPRPSSPRFCRPIRLQVCHETTEIAINEK